MGCDGRGSCQCSWSSSCCCTDNDACGRATSTTSRRCRGSCHSRVPRLSNTAADYRHTEATHRQVSNLCDTANAASPAGCCAASCTSTTTRSTTRSTPRCSTGNTAHKRGRWTSDGGVPRLPNTAADYRHTTTIDSRVSRLPDAAKTHLKQAWSSGRTRAFQALSAGSTPAACTIYIST